MASHGRYVGEYVAGCADGQCNYFGTGRMPSTVTKELTRFFQFSQSGCMDDKGPSSGGTQFEVSDLAIAPTFDLM
jgi:hypothetical protein